VMEKWCQRQLECSADRPKIIPDTFPELAQQILFSLREPPINFYVENARDAGINNVTRIPVVSAIKQGDMATNSTHAGGRWYGTGLHPMAMRSFIAKSAGMHWGLVLDWNGQLIRKRVMTPPGLITLPPTTSRP